MNQEGAPCVSPCWVSSVWKSSPGVRQQLARHILPRNPDGGGGAGGGDGGSDALGMNAGDSQVAQKDGPGGGTDAPITSADAGSFPPAGDPSGSCTTLTLPSEAQLVDTSSPTTVVGTGTPASCTFAALNAAVTQGRHHHVRLRARSRHDPGHRDAHAARSRTDSACPQPQHRHRRRKQGHARRPERTSASCRGSTPELANEQGHAHPPAHPPHQRQDDAHARRSRPARRRAASRTPRARPATTTARAAPSTCRTAACASSTASSRHNQAALLGPDTGGGAIYLYGTGTPSYIVQSTFLEQHGEQRGRHRHALGGRLHLSTASSRATAPSARARTTTTRRCARASNMRQQEPDRLGRQRRRHLQGRRRRREPDDLRRPRSRTTLPTSSAPRSSSRPTARARSSSSTTRRSPGNSSTHRRTGSGARASPPTSRTRPASTSSPSPIMSTFCDQNGSNCTSTCGS